MVYWIRILPAIVITIAAAVFGLVKRQSYTEILREKDFMDQMLVAELPEQMAANTCEQMEKELESAPVVLRVIPVGGREYFFSGGRQKVAVKEVYEGEKIAEGQELYLTFHRWSIVFVWDDKAAECGFVNVMREGREYLVFLDEAFESLDGEAVYPFYGNTIVTPMFCYDEADNVVIPLQEGEMTYVPYTAVKENEFFATSESAVQSLTDLKHRIIGCYPKRY